MNRLFIRESQGRLTSAAGNPIDKVNIAVTGLGQNVGTTFVASSLAFYFAEKGNNLTFTQCLTPSRSNGLLYDVVAMDQRFHSLDFCSWSRSNFFSQSQGVGSRQLMPLSIFFLSLIGFPSLIKS